MKNKIPDPPPPQDKQFTKQEIEKGISKIQKRILDINELKNKNLHWDDPQIKSLQNLIDENLREIFGANSSTYRKNIDFHIYHDDGSFFNHEGDGGIQRSYLIGIPYAVGILTGLIKFLEEKFDDITDDSTANLKDIFNTLDINKRIHETISLLFNDGHYSEAVFNASKVLINSVKERSGKFELDGAPLMRTVFSKSDPVLAFNELKDQSDFDEQEGLMHLFEGAVLAIRNPRGHDIREDPPKEAFEYICFLSLLANKLATARKVR